MLGSAAARSRDLEQPAFIRRQLVDAGLHAAGLGPSQASEHILPTVGRTRGASDPNEPAGCACPCRGGACVVCGWCGGADGTEEAGSCPGMATASASCGFLGRKQPQSCRNPVWGPHRERRLGVPRRRGVALLLSGGHGDHPRKAATTVTGEHRARAKTRGPARRLRAPRCRGSVRYHSPAQRTRPVE